jgi:hypothetical protein
MNTSFNDFQASQPDLSDAQEMQVVKTYVALLDEIIAQKNAINTHAISLSTLKKWAANHINVAAINAAEGPLDELRNAIALALQELALTVWSKHNGKNDHMIYLGLAREIKGLTPETLEALSNNHGMLEDAKASKPPLGIAAVVLAGVIVVIVYLFASNTDKNKQYEFSNPTGVVNDAPQSFTTIEDPKTKSGASATQVAVVPGEGDNSSLIKVINTMDKHAKFVLLTTAGKPVGSCYIEPKGESVMRSVKTGLYTFRIATGNPAGLRSYTGETQWKGTQFEDSSADSLFVLESNTQFTRTTLWLEANPFKGVVYQLHQEMSEKKKK